MSLAGTLTNRAVNLNGWGNSPAAMSRSNVLFDIVKRHAASGIVRSWQSVGLIGGTHIIS
jgi:hypothetical protein